MSQPTFGTETRSELPSAANGTTMMSSDQLHDSDPTTEESVTVENQTVNSLLDTAQSEHEDEENENDYQVNVGG